MLLRSRRRDGVSRFSPACSRCPKAVAPAKSTLSAYREYAEQILQAFRKGLAGEKTTASDVNGSRRAIFNGQ
jgi:hypothetical protein